MKLRLFGEITDPVTKEMNAMWGIGEDAVTSNDVHKAIADKAEDDKEINMQINCPGGNCIEGFAIYDLMRSLENHTITAEVIGECSSMATIVLLAASRRKAHPNARICIHKPRFIDFYAPTMTEDEARRLHDDLHAETERLKKIYLDRTTMSEEQLEELMTADKYITAEDALALGVITEIIQPMTATTTKRHMNKFARALKAFTDAMKEDEQQVVAMTLNAEDGTAIEIEREEGDPQVGDTASPDGEWKMADGTTIVIAEGVITEIKPAEPAEEEMTEEEMAEAIATMTEAMNALTAENEALKSQIEDLTNQLSASKANERTEADKEALQLVANGGGIEWLKSLGSSYAPKGRTSQKNVSDDVKKRIEEAKKKLLK